MATTGKINGTIIGLYKVVTGTPDTYTKIANGRSANFDLSVDMIETTEKDSGGFKEYIAGEKGGTFQFEGVLEYESSVSTQGLSFDDLVTDALAGTAFTIRWSSQSTGDQYMQSSVLISGVS
ncbi:MAG: phage tail tube protein, partial [Bacteroidota bacterium]